MGEVRATARLRNFLDVGLAERGLEIEILGRTMVTDCVVGPPLCEPLIGQLVLEQLDLIVDCARKTLAPRPESPNLPLLKLK